MIEIAMQVPLPLSRIARFPKPYSIRAFVPGDESLWFDLQCKTGIYSSLEENVFVDTFDRDDLDLRQYYVLHRDEPVGTGTAWVGAPLRSPEWGRIHWVAIVPEHQRRGLASQLMWYLLDVLRAFGCTGAFLTTGSENKPAIALYQSLGFSAWVRSEAEERFWSTRS